MNAQVLAALLWWVTHDEEMTKKLSKFIVHSLHGVLTEEQVTKAMHELYISSVNR